MRRDAMKLNELKLEKKVRHKFSQLRITLAKISQQLSIETKICKISYFTVISIFQLEKIASHTL